MRRRIWPGRPRPSTRAFTREAQRTPGFTRFDWLHGYVYARWPYLYIGTALGEHRLARAVQPLIRAWSWLFPPQPDGESSVGSTGFADTYHGKVVPLEAATRLVTVQRDITLTDLEQVIPYTLARDIVLRSPDHIVALECPCRAARSKPCLPLDVCLIVGEPFASFIAEHHPGRSRWITQDEAVKVLKAEQERGHVSHAFFKDAMLGRFYAICNCCSCCCGAMQARRHGTPMLISSGYISLVDSGECSGCGTCSLHCQFSAIEMQDGIAVVDQAQCMGCGVCVAHCQQGAITLQRDAGKCEPLEIHELVAQAALIEEAA